jgi:ribosomal-protein-alanine N-acetyltransferase
MQFEQLTTPRLILRKLTPEAYGYLYANFDDSYLMEFLGMDAEALQKEKEKYRQGLTSYNRTQVNFQLIEKDSGRVIGACGFHTWSPQHLRAEIGYHLNNDTDKRKGYMSEAVYAVLKYGFDEMKLHRVEALADPNNVPSIRIIEKFNFTFEATLREHYNVDGVMEDSVMYSLLKNEFKRI